MTMDPWRRDAEQWLASEQQGQDDAAEEAFTRVFQALPRIEPRADFADRVVRGVWLAERRRRRTGQLARIAAVLLVTVAGVAIGYAAIDYTGTWILEAVAGVTSRGVSGFIALVRVGVKSWSVVAGIGNGVGTALATPENTVALLAMELLGLLALFGLQRLLPDKLSTVSSVEART
jgi:hypothetical protein